MHLSIITIKLGFGPKALGLLNKLRERPCLFNMNSISFFLNTCSAGIILYFTHLKELILVGKPYRKINTVCSFNVRLGI